MIKAQWVMDYWQKEKRKQMKLFWAFPSMGS